MYVAMSKQTSVTKHSLYVMVIVTKYLILSNEAAVFFWILPVKKILDIAMSKKYPVGKKC